MASRSRATCPACAATVPVDARWCGSCGATIAPAAPTEDRPEPEPGPTRLPGGGALVLAGAVLAVVALAGVGLSGDRLGGGPSPSFEVGLDEDVADLVQEVTDRGPVCLRTPDCVAWLEPASIAGRTPTATVHGDLTLVRVRDGLEARDTGEGVLRWRTDLADAADRGTYLPVLTAPVSSLALLTDAVGDDSTLTAVDLLTGRVRWRLPEVAEVTALREHDEALLVQVVRTPGAAPEGERRRGRQEEVVAVDPRDGEVRWSTGGKLLHLVDDGVVVVTAEAAEARQPDGSTRWATEWHHSFEAAWVDVTGRFFQVFSVDGRRTPIVGLADGEYLEVDGELVHGDLAPVADPDGGPRRPFHHDVATVVDRANDGSTVLTLLDGDTAAWQVTFERLGCCAPVEVDGDRVRIPASDGGRWVLDRADGSVVDRTPPPAERSRTSSLLPSYGGVSVEELDVASPTTTDLVLIEDDERTARLPAGTWPVAVEDEIIVLRSHTWVAAIRRDAVTEPQ